MALDQRFGDDSQSKEDNIGSLSAIRLVRVSDIVSFVVQLGGVQLEYSAFEGMYATTDTARFREAGKLTNDGAQNNAQITWVTPKDRPELRNYLNDNAEEEYIVLYTDGNGERWVMGTDEEPAQKAETQTTGRGTTQRNQYDVKFVAQTSQKKYSVLSETITTATNLIFQDNNNWVWQDANNAIAQESI